MAKFLVLFQIPQDVIAGWRTTPAAEREPAEKAMMADWNAWMAAKGSGLTGMQVGGQTKAVTSDGIADTKNDIMLYCFLDADSHDEAAKLFEGHPHLTIPRASIEVMAVRPMGPD